MLELQILGPLVVQVNGNSVSLGPRLRILLLALLVARRQAVPAPRLAQLVWSGAPPAGWRRTLRSHVYHLRRVLTSDQAKDCSGLQVITAIRLGEECAYALRVSDDQVDAWRAERLLGQARKVLVAGQPEEASGILAHALASWHGDPLADVADMPFAIDEARRLGHMLRSIRVAKIEAAIGLGLHYEIIGELESMVTRWPDDLLLRHLLVLALHRGGRVADAARVCREGIEAMLNQGLEASGLQALQRQILASAPALPTPNTVVATD